MPKFTKVCSFKFLVSAPEAWEVLDSRNLLSHPLNCFWLEPNRGAHFLVSTPAAGCQRETFALSQKSWSPNCETHSQCDLIWQNFAILAKVSKSFGKFLMVYFKMLSLLWQICDIIGPILIVANCQNLKTNLTIGLHCRLATLSRGKNDKEIPILQNF